MYEEHSHEKVDFRHGQAKETISLMINRAAMQATQLLQTPTNQRPRSNVHPASKPPTCDSTSVSPTHETSPNHVPTEGTSFIPDIERLHIISYNMRGFESNQLYLHTLLQKADILCIQEHWLHHHEKEKIERFSKTHFHVIKTFDEGTPCLTKYKRGKGGSSHSH